MCKENLVAFFTKVILNAPAVSFEVGIAPQVFSVCLGRVPVLPTRRQEVNLKKDISLTKTVTKKKLKKKAVTGFLNLNTALILSHIF